MWEPWCEFVASIDASRAAEPISVIIQEQQQAATGASSSSSSSAAAATIRPGTVGGAGIADASAPRDAAGAMPAGSVSGRRFRLAPIDAAATRALPTRGKVRLLVWLVC